MLAPPFPGAFPCLISQSLFPNPWHSGLLSSGIQAINFPGSSGSKRECRSWNSHLDFKSHSLKVENPPYPSMIHPGSNSHGSQG